MKRKVWIFIWYLNCKHDKKINVARSRLPSANLYFIPNGLFSHSGSHMQYLVFINLQFFIVRQLAQASLSKYRYLDREQLSHYWMMDSHCCLGKVAALRHFHWILLQSLHHCSLRRNMHDQIFMNIPCFQCFHPLLSFCFFNYWGRFAQQISSCCS